MLRGLSDKPFSTPQRARDSLSRLFGRSVPKNFPLDDVDLHNLTFQGFSKGDNLLMHLLGAGDDARPALLGFLCNAVRLEYAPSEAGDCCVAAFEPGQKKFEVYFWNHELPRPDRCLADSVEAYLLLIEAHERQARGLTDKVPALLAKLRHRVNPEPMNLDFEGFKPRYKPKGRLLELAKRAGPVLDFVLSEDDAPKRPPAERGFEKALASRHFANDPAEALFWMFHSLFTRNLERAEEVLAAVSRTEALLVQYGADFLRQMLAAQSLPKSRDVPSRHR